MQRFYSNYSVVSTLCEHFTHEPLRCAAHLCCLCSNSYLQSLLCNYLTTVTFHIEYFLQLLPHPKIANDLCVQWTNQSVIVLKLATVSHGGRERHVRRFLPRVRARARNHNPTRGHNSCARALESTNSAARHAAALFVSNSLGQTPSLKMGGQIEPVACTRKMTEAVGYTAVITCMLCQYSSLTTSFVYCVMKLQLGIR